MDRKILVAFTVLGVGLGIIRNLANLIPEVLANPPQSPDLTSIILVLIYVSWPILVAGVGYWAGGRVPVEAQPIHFPLVTGIAGGLGFLLTTIVMLQLNLALMADSVLARAVSVGANSVLSAISIGLFGMAGASITRFRILG